MNLKKTDMRNLNVLLKQLKMKRKILPLLMSASLLALTACVQHPSACRLVGTTPLNPEDTCYAKGVSGAFCGILDGHVILAGGANFPGRPAAEGGGKHYYNTVWAASLQGLDEAEGRHPQALRWQQVTVLPMPLAYGVTVADSAALYFVGGCNGMGGTNVFYRLSLEKGGMRFKSLAPLPVTMDNMAGARVGRRIYVVGGMADGQPSSAMYAYDPEYREWFACAPVPGQPRVQPVCVALDNKLYVWGGYSQPFDSTGVVIHDECMVHTDGWCYDPAEDAWSPVAAPQNAAGRHVTLTGASAVAWDSVSIVAVGGVDDRVFLGGIRGEFPMPDYMLHPDEWYRFNRNVLRYNAAADQWQIADSTRLTARAGAAFVTLPDVEGREPEALLLGGEYRPGIRSTEATLVTIK